jgi:hypothetical protein
VESADYEDLRPPVFSANGKHLACAVEKDEKWRLLLDGHAGELYDGMQSPVFGSDSKHLAYPARKGGKWRLVTENL